MKKIILGLLVFVFVLGFSNKVFAYDVLEFDSHQDHGSGYEGLWFDRLGIEDPQNYNYLSCDYRLNADYNECLYDFTYNSQGFGSGGTYTYTEDLIKILFYRYPTLTGNYTVFITKGPTSNPDVIFLSAFSYDYDTNTFSSILIEEEPDSCFDGIQNQDETGIDNGGVCVFYTKIDNTSNGSIELMDGADDSADIIKTLPEDWIVQVTDVRDSSGDPVSADGYYWYEVVDPTDGVSGWMKGSNDTETTFYLPYNIDDQDEYVEKAVDQYSTSTTRATKILEAINHYYNNTDNTDSLYSSDDDDSNVEISLLKDSGFPKKVIWGMSVEESGKNNYDFNNELVSPDYGHGIMQLTFNALGSEPGTNQATYDNRGIGSKISIPDCDSVGVSNYVNCYTYAGTGNDLPKPYKRYMDELTNSIYKYYTNTEQSIYANIKDAMHLLSFDYDLYDYITTPYTDPVTLITYSADDIKNILTVRRYNGASDKGCRYVDRVATNLDNIDDYFSGESASDISSLISKMHSAGSQVICANLYSPGDLSIKDSKGRTVGVVNGKGVNDFPIADYDKKNKNVIILAAEDDNYKYNVTGTAKGAYGLDITIKNGDQITKFEARDIAMLPGQIHSYSVDKEAIRKGKKGVTVSIDRNGDGIVDRTIKIGKTLSGDVYNLGATSEEIEAFKIGDVPNLLVE